jgi:site-specific DNA-methyltransferase (adenine-specific)
MSFKGMKLLNGDCLEIMKIIEDSSIDAIITDPPYGTTECKWDSVIDFDLMWEQLNRIIKPNGAIVLFGSEPFSSALRMSNIKNYKYDIIWQKNNFTGFLRAKKAPLKAHEVISIFCNSTENYYPQKWLIRDEFIDKRKTLNNTKIKDGVMKNIKRVRNADDGTRYPTSVVQFIHKPNKNLHPTQKPVALMEYLIKTYTNEGETVLDFTMGSGSTGVAAKNTNRNFIGIEQDDKYFEIAKNRIHNITEKL